MPRKRTGFTGHADIGGGISLNSFDKGPFVTGLEKAYGVKFDIKAYNSVVFEFGGGFDYFFSKDDIDLSVNLDGRLLGFAVARTSGWKIDIHEFLPSNFQVLLGVRYWLKN